MRARLNPPGSPPPIRNTWLQTERSAHENWAQLCMRNKASAAVLHMLVSMMQNNNAVVISRATLAGLLATSESTVKRSIIDLKKHNWIEIVQVGGKGGVNAYVVNSLVAWSTHRSLLPIALFTATVVASKGEQNEIATEPLKRIPVLGPGELASPQGPGLDPPSQPGLDGIPPSAIELREGEELDPITGEIQRRFSGFPPRSAASPKPSGPGRVSGAAPAKKKAR